MNVLVMNSDDTERMLRFYEDSFAQHGNDPRSVHWSGEISQGVRFEVLAGIAPLAGKSVLDVGAGLGDLYKFFLANQIPVDYTGIDIVPAFIERAQERFPDTRFVLGDMSSLDEDYDYILVSGAFNFTVADSKEYYFAMIKHLFAYARSGLSFNMLDATAHPTNETYIAYDIDEVTRYCKTLTDNVKVISGYLPQDFTVYMYKQAS